MEKKDYLAMVHREANLLLQDHEALVRETMEDESTVTRVESVMGEQFARILTDIDHLEDVLKWSGLREPEAPLWRNSDSWQGVLIGAAMAALTYDVRECAVRIIKGELPRLRNIQVN